MFQSATDLLPDLGQIIWQQVRSQPFRLSVFEAGSIRVTESSNHRLWSVTLTLQAFVLEPFVSVPPTPMLTIELPQATQEQAWAYVERLKAAEPLTLQVKSHLKYWSQEGEWVYPAYPVEGSADLQRLEQARARRDRRAARVQQCR